MCQVKVMEILKSNPKKWYSAREIFNILKVTGMPSINMSLKKLNEFDLVFRKDAKVGFYSIYLYKYKYTKRI